VANTSTLPISETSAQRTPTEGIVAALRRITAIEGLTDCELTWLAEHGGERFSTNGTLITRVGAPADSLIFILAGEVHVHRTEGGPIGFFIGRFGQMTGRLPYSRMKTYGGNGYAVGDVWALDIHESLFPAMLEAIPSMAQRCVSALLDRVREVTRMEQQAEKLDALGKLAANLSHELNNPASAARSAATNLFAELRHYGDQKYRLGSLCLSDEERTNYQQWLASVRDKLSPDCVANMVSSVQQSDREDLFSRWLTNHSIAEDWMIAPVLAETGITTEDLDRLATIASTEVLPVSLSAFASSLRAERMTEAVIDSTARIFDLITAIKDYSYMDQTPIQEIDLAQSLDSTLAMLNSRLGKIKVVRDYATHLPPISAYGGELTQVWTALIENSIDSMKGTGTLRLHTAIEAENVSVEIWDNGPGIAPEIRSRIFEPFFTTKPIGAGLGLGLDTANRIVTKHRGAISVESAPGKTCFKVRLPIEQAGAY